MVVLGVLRWLAFELLALTSREEGQWYVHGPLVLSLTLHVANNVAGRHQNDEKDLRKFHAVPGTARGHFPTVDPYTRPSCAGSRHLPGSNDQETEYMHGVYGWQFVPIDEGQRS